MSSSSPALTRLATYGTLAPGEVNSHVLAGLEGRWTKGVVRGWLRDAGWGARHGCPGIELDPHGDPVDVHVFQAEALVAHWDRLDAFEGPEYRRTEVCVTTGDGAVSAYIYALDPDGKRAE